MALSRELLNAWSTSLEAISQPTDSTSLPTCQNYTFCRASDKLRSLKGPRLLNLVLFHSSNKLTTVSVSSTEGGGRVECGRCAVRGRSRAQVTGGARGTCGRRVLAARARQVRLR